MVKAVDNKRRGCARVLESENGLILTALLQTAKSRLLLFQGRRNLILSFKHGIIVLI